MDDIESLRQAGLAADDIAGALALSTAVGWNQTAADWAFFIARGHAFGLFDARHRLVATAAALPYEDGFGWISMVIVAADWRRRGLARRLMGACVETLRQQGRAALLDATPEGAEVYRRLGFVALGGMERWEGQGGAKPAGTGITPMAPDAADLLIAADHAAFGARRHFLLRDFLSRPGALALGHGDGFLVLRPGQRATQLGPLTAVSAEIAGDLLAEAIAGANGPVFLDLMDPWKSLAPLLETRGFRRQRPFRRMALGRNTLPGDAARLVCAAGPEFG
ncbi:MAG TPA: GNAT family N-acetyltransferase [Stellaceae bacterium]|nr:GNAT family N-acetyltransferase [Stellaceae bacterium]